MLGGTPVPACTYNFGVTTVAQFVATARIFENVGVTAYAGAVNSISSETLLTVAASTTAAAATTAPPTTTATKTTTPSITTSQSSATVVAYSPLALLLGLFMMLLTR